MIAKFAKKINEILIQKEIVQKEDAELYQYGIENGIVVAGNLFGFWNIWHCDGETGTCSGLPVILCLVEKL